MREATDLDPRHRSALGRLADQLAVQQRYDIDRTVEAHPQFAPAGPCHPSTNALAGDELDRNTFSKSSRQVGSKGRAQTGYLANFALAPGAAMVDRSCVEGPLIGTSTIVGPWKPIPDDDSCDGEGVSQCVKSRHVFACEAWRDAPNKSLTKHAVKIRGG